MDKDLGFGLICFFNYSRSKTALKVFLELVKGICEKDKKDYSSYLESKVYSAGVLSLPFPRFRAMIFQTKDLTLDMILHSKKLVIMEPRMEPLVYAKFNGQLTPSTKQRIESRITKLNVPFYYLFPYAPELETLLRSQLMPLAKEYVETYT